MRYTKVGLTFLWLIMFLSLNALAQSDQEPPPTNVITVAWSPDGSMIVGGNSEGIVSIWDAKSGETSYSFVAHNNPIYSLTWGSDEQTLITGSVENVIHVWNIENQALLRNIELPGGTVLALEVSPDGTLLASINFDYVQTLSLWNLADYTLLDSTQIGDSMGLKWNPQGDLLALAHTGSGVILLDLNNIAEGERVGSRIPASSVSWSPDGSYLVSGEFDPSGPSEVSVWNTSSGEQVAVLGSHPYETDVRVAWSPDGQLITSAGNDVVLYIYDAQTYQELEQYNKAKAYIHDIAFSPYGGRLAYGGQELSDTDSAFSNGAIRVIVPAPSLVRLGFIAPLCIANSDSIEALELLSPEAMGALTIEMLPEFIAHVEALPEGSIPAGCATDLIAVAEAVIAQ